MRTFNGGYKEYRKATANEIIRFIRDEKQRVSSDSLDDYESLSLFDLRLELTYLLFLDGRPVGFCCAKIASANNRRLTKIYVTPAARRHGCGGHVLRNLKITQVTIPVRCIQFISLCQTIGFFYNPQQNYPNSIAELSRQLSET